MPRPPKHQLPEYRAYLESLGTGEQEVKTFTRTIGDMLEAGVDLGSATSITGWLETAPSYQRQALARALETYATHQQTTAVVGVRWVKGRYPPQPEVHDLEVSGFLWLLQRATPVSDTELRHLDRQRHVSPARMFEDKVQRTIVIRPMYPNAPGVSLRLTGRQKPEAYLESIFSVFFRTTCARFRRDGDTHLFVTTGEQSGDDITDSQIRDWRSMASIHDNRFADSVNPAEGFTCEVLS